MNVYVVYTGEYPFADFLGHISAETAEEALAKAIKHFGKEFPHPVVQEEVTASMYAH
jgi:hypothetical protein